MSHPSTRTVAKLYQSAVALAVAQGHVVTNCTCGGPRLHAKGFVASRCLACGEFQGPKAEASKASVLTDEDRALMRDCWPAHSIGPGHGARGLDPTVVDFVGQAIEQGHTVKPCKECGGPDVHSKDRAGISKCLRCGRAVGIRAVRSGERQPFTLPYTMTPKARIARYFDTSRACRACGGSMRLQRGSARYCSSRCQKRARRAA